MFLFPGIRGTGQELVKAACERLKEEYPALIGRAIVICVPVPGPVQSIDRRLFGGRLGSYAMCLNHWVRFLSAPVILINAEWLRDCERLRQRYRHDVASNYHPGCGCPVRYIVSHEIAHFIYVRMGRERREQWESAYEPGKPSGYSTTPEESFCEAFAGHVSGLPGQPFELAAALAGHYRASVTE